MKFTCVVIITGVFACLVCGTVSAFVVTMDDISPCDNIRYYDRVGCCFVGPFVIQSHSDSSWWSPHSGSNVVACNQSSSAKIVFKRKRPLNVSLLGAYFSTMQSVVVRLTAYDSDGQVITSVEIGSNSESWSNHYMQIDSPEGRIFSVILEPVSSADALLYFCFDDLQIEPKAE